MLKKEIDLLLVEDDDSLGKAMKSALERAGYPVKWVLNSEDALQAFKFDDYKCVILDCMLPGKSGLDLAQELRKTGHQFDVILTSGIFCGKQYILEAIRKTDAIEFLTKPFEIEDLVETVDENFNDLIREERTPIHELFGVSNYSQHDKVNTIAANESTQGFDLPFIYSMLLDTQLKGDLHITYADNDTESVVGFNAGRIDKVIYPDSESYFGILLVENGFTSYDEVQEALSNETNKRLGEKLVDINSLSPHAIQLVSLEQMKIRLSKTIRPTSVTVKWVHTEKRNSQFFLDESHFGPALSDWILSKIDYEWLETIYTSWEDCPIEQGAHYSKLNLLAPLPVIAQAGELVGKLDYPQKLSTILTEIDRVKEPLRALHFLVSMRLVVFGNASQELDFEGKKKRLSSIKAEHEKSNYFEVLGLTKNARDSEIARSYQDLARALHPDKLPKSAPSDLVDLATEVFANITQAFRTLKDEKAKNKYLKELELGQADDILKAETEFEEARKLLTKGLYTDAHRKLRELLKAKERRTDILVYYLWAKIKRTLAANKVDNDFVNHILIAMNKIAPEDRHNVVYFYVKGLHYIVIDEFSKAHHCFKHCISLDPSFIEAKKEISLLKSLVKKSGASQDVTQIFGTLFRKKSG